jgi:hypothetical protein
MIKNNAPEFPKRQLIMSNEEKEYILNDFNKNRQNYDFKYKTEMFYTTIHTKNIKNLNDDIGYRIVGNYLEYLGSLEKYKITIDLNCTPARALLTDEELAWLNALFL